jgi:16S rRNA (cytosine967-C5)-methyltransferase
LIAPARIAALEVLCRIELAHEHSDDALNSGLIAELEPRDRNLITEIVYGTLRWRGWLDHVLGSAITRGWDGVDAKARALLRMSLYQMARMDRLPDHAVINDAVELAKKHLRARAAGFVNGVLRNLARGRPWTANDFHRDAPLWVRVSLPEWVWRRWETRFGEDRACEYALSLNQAPGIAVRAPNGDSLASGRASEIVPGAYLIDEGADAADFRMVRRQDEASQLIPQLLGDLRGARVWDACAAPGGKTAILKEMCGPTGQVVASDLDYARALRLREALHDAAGARADIVVANAGAAYPFRSSFDAVLADVPCSGLGTLRRNPDIKWRFQEEWLGGMGEKQGRILRAVAAAVAPRGKILYSTCSTEPEENEQVIAGFLQAHPDFHIARPDFPAGIESWLGPDGFFRSYPSPRAWDGFFAALLTRN